MTKVYLSIPSLWSFRNFVYSNIIDDLKKKYEFTLLVPEGSNYLKVIEKLGYNYIQYPINEYKFTERLFIKALNLKLLRNNEALKKSKLVLLSVVVPSSISGKIIHTFTQIISFCLPFQILFYFYKKAAKDKRYNEIVAQVSENVGSLLIATNIVVKHELILFLQFVGLKNKKIDFINSFDNTTSRGFIPFIIFDRHIVWNNKMTQELVDIFHVQKSEVEILGTPQFDLLSLGGKTPLNSDDPQFKIVENSKFILYCAGHYSFTPLEVKIVKEMIQELNKSFDDLHYVIRVHPLDNWERWKENGNLPTNVTMDYPWKQNSTNPLMSLPEKYEYLRHGRLLNNAMLILNIGSTTSLDACVLNRPVYNVCFDTYNQKGELDMIYNSEHYSPIIASNSAPLVFNISQLEEIISVLLQNSEAEELQLKRISFAKEYCGFDETINFAKRFDRFLERSPLW
jgi:hypothetical protein